MGRIINVAEYRYFYGAGSEPNRKIEFQQEEGNPQTIQAKIFAFDRGNWKEISSLSGDKINAEMMSTSEKVKGLKEERKGIFSPRTPDKKLSELPITEQERILRNLEPQGSWRIEISNGIGKDPYFEKVIQLNLYNPA